MKRDTVSIGEIAVVTSGGTPDRENSAYWGGAIPWVKTTLVQNCQIDACDVDEHITEMGLKSSSAKLIPAGAILMAMVGQGKTRGQVAILNIDATINQNCAAIILKDGVDTRYVYQQFLFRYEEIRNASNSSGQQNLNAGLIRELRIPLPDHSSQYAIGKLLFEWDAAITKTEQLISAKERQHRWLQHRLIDHKSVRQHWDTLELGSVLRERSERSAVHDEYPVFTSSRRGLFLQSEYFSKQVTSEDNTGYKIMRRGDFTFRSMSDDGRFVFNRLQRYETGIISPAYGVFYAEGACPEFLAHYLNSSYFGQLLARETQGGTRKALRYSALAGMDVDLPNRADQERIAAFLDESRREIDLLQTQLETLRRQKRGLMQKLLTGQWRVKVPEAEAA
ncbi:MAG: type I restriction endonuclease subunit S [Betaproteobacteria bacterium]|nr:MAG: type I restriction endonuclease subunit S [Betaproteobacteria bacterium]